MAPRPTNPTLFGLGIRCFRKPFQTGVGSAFQAILAPDPSVVLKYSNKTEEVLIIYFAQVRLGSIWNSGHLGVPDFRKVFLRSTREIAAHDLRMIPIELNFQSWIGKLLEDAVRLFDRRKIISRDIPGIDRFNQNGDSGSLDLAQRVFEVA